MNTLFWFSFLFWSPSPPPPPPPPVDTCAAQGLPVFEIRERSEVKAPTSTTAIFASGAWKFESFDGDGHLTAEAHGCLAKQELRSIRRTVQRAPWRITSSPVACFAYSPEFTQYVLHGKVRYTHRMCSGKTADHVTLEAIRFVEQSLADDLPPKQPPIDVAEPPPPPPIDVAPPPPVKPIPPIAACRAEGTPVFEIRRRSEAQEPTSTIAIYSTGAWTFQPIERDGTFGSLLTGCFDKQTTTMLRSVINKAPWDVTISQIVCRAYSPSWKEYFVHGKYEYTARLCGEQRIDDSSAAAIKLIEAELAKVLPKQTLGY